LIIVEVGLKRKNKCLDDVVDSQIRDEIKSWMDLTGNPGMVSALLVRNATLLSMEYCSDGHAITTNLLNSFLATLSLSLETDDNTIDAESSELQEAFETRPKRLKVH
jgi:hypothetical protein